MSFKLVYLILRIRIKQLYRLFHNIDFIRLLFLLLLLAVVSIMLFGWSSRREYIAWWITFCSLIIMSIHLSRKDKGFISGITRQPFLIFCAEYLMLLIPVFAFFLLHRNWAGFYLVPVILLISLMKGRVITSANETGIWHTGMTIRLPGSRQISTGNPAMFEWNSGLRHTWLFYGFIYFVILAFSFKGYVSHIGLILISVLVSGYYFNGEPRQFIEVFSYSASNFIKRKVWLGFKYLTVVNLPIVLISLIAQTEMWYLLILAQFIAFVILFLAIVFKYGLFRENANLERNSPILMITIIGLLLPFLWPLPVYMGIRYYRKALKNLKPYFNA
jgi:hypothetical protein